MKDFLKKAWPLMITIVYSLFLIIVGAMNASEAMAIGACFLFASAFSGLCYTKIGIGGLVLSIGLCIYPIYYGLFSRNKYVDIPWWAVIVLMFLPCAVIIAVGIILLRKGKTMRIMSAEKPISNEVEQLRRELEQMRQQIAVMQQGGEAEQVPQTTEEEKPAPQVVEAPAPADEVRAVATETLASQAPKTLNTIRKEKAPFILWIIALALLVAAIGIFYWPAFRGYGVMVSRNKLRGVYILYTDAKQFHRYIGMPGIRGDALSPLFWTGAIIGFAAAILCTIKAKRKWRAFFPALVFEAGAIIICLILLVIMIYRLFYFSGWQRFGSYIEVTVTPAIILVGGILLLIDLQQLWKNSIKHQYIEWRKERKKESAYPYLVEYRVGQPKENVKRTVSTEYIKQFKRLQNR